MILTEVRQAWRGLLRAPRFMAACIVTLALALTGTATLLNLLETFVFRRLAVAAPDQLVDVYPAIGETSVGFSPEAFRSIAARQEVLTGLCGVTAGYGAVNVQLDAGAVRQRPAEAVSGACYEMLGVAPFLGRTITTDDAPLTGEPRRVVLVSYRLWLRELGARSDVVGRTLRVEGTPLTIVGVLPATYRGLNADEAPDIAFPLSLPWTLRWQPPLVMHAIGRLRPGIGIARANAYLGSIWPDVFDSTQSASTARTPAPTLRVKPGANGFSALRERYRQPLYVLGALAGCLLLLAAVNVGGLLLARLLDRRDRLAVRLALGASRWRLAVRLWCEGMLIAMAAVCLAIPFSRRGAQAAGQLLWPGTRPISLDTTSLATTLLFMTAIGLLVAFVVALPGVIAVFGQRWDLGARSAGHGSGRVWHRGLTAVQIALSVVLIFCAVLFTENLWNAERLPLGYESARLQWVQLDSTSRTGMATTVGYADTLLTQLARLPGVEQVAMSTMFGRVAPQFGERIQVRNAAAGAAGIDTIIDRVSPGFFRTASIPLRQGREFRWSDVSSRGDVVVLNRSLAERLFQHDDAVGKVVWLTLGQINRALHVVGIAADATPGDPRVQRVPQIYFPLGPEAPPAPVLLLRVRDEPLTEASLRGVIDPLGRHQVVRVSTMAEQADRFLAQEVLIASTSLMFALLALIVSIAGLYASLSQDVTRRTREIAVRIAVGATPHMVRALVLSDAYRALLIGVGLGVPAALAAGQAARVLLSGVPPNTPVLLTVVGSAMVMLVLCVSAWPARRAGRTEPAAALRAE